MDAVTNTLRADLSELRRTVVIGTTGSGKTTTAARLAATLSVPRVELDAINWQADWIALTDTDVPLFRSRVAEAVRGDAWVVDGNYSVARDIVWPRATAIVWLNYPFGLVFSRLVRRTLRRTRQSGNTMGRQQGASHDAPVHPRLALPLGVQEPLAAAAHPPEALPGAGAGPPPSVPHAKGVRYRAMARQCGER